MAYPFVKFPECSTSADKQLNVCSVHRTEKFLNDTNHVSSRNIFQEKKMTPSFSGGKCKDKSVCVGRCPMYLQVGKSDLIRLIYCNQLRLLI